MIDVCVKANMQVECVIIFHSFIYLLLTADCCLAQGIVKSFTKGNIWIHANLNHNCMMERSFIFSAFCFWFFSPYDLVAFRLANLRGTFQRADKWMGKGYESATKQRGELSLFKHLNRLWWNKKNFLFNPSCQWADIAGQIVLKNKVQYTYRNILFLSLVYSTALCKILIVKLWFWRLSMSSAHSVPNRKKKKRVNGTLSPWTSKYCMVPLAS